MSEHAAVLFANEAFYLAFSSRDMEAMDAVWSREHPVTCLHPGWGALEGRDAVMKSWQSILSNPNSPAISCRTAVAHVIDSLAYVICYEVLEGGYLIATNVFVHEGSAWRMIHHQAGATSAVPEDEESETPDTLQ